MVGTKRSNILKYVVRFRTSVLALIFFTVFARFVGVLVRLPALT